MNTPLRIGSGLLLAIMPACLIAAPKPASLTARTPLVEIEDHPKSIHFTNDQRVLLDFGQATFGYLEYRPKQNDVHSAMVAWLGEKSNDDGTVDRKPGGTIRAQRIEAIEGKGRAVFEPTWKPMYANWIENPQGAREIMPFRYVEISGIDTQPDSSEFVRISRYTEFDDHAASFQSDNSDLNEVWEFCKASIKYTTFMGLYVDGDRERKPYEADAFINQLCHYAAEPHYLTGRLTHEHLLKYPTWPTEWRQHSILMAWADFLYSGCDASIRTHYDTLVKRLLLDRRRGEDGLLVGQNQGEPRDIIDWPHVERDQYDMAPRIKTVTTAFHAHSLELMSKIATALNRNDDATRFDQLRQQTVNSMIAKLICPVRGIFIDGIDHESGSPSSHASLHANMVPLAFGLVPDDHLPAVATFIRSRGMACSVYGAQYLLDALYHAGDAQHALDLMTATHDRSWIHMFRTLGSTISLEAWDMKYKPNLDWNHAWGAVPINVISRKLMGIEPIEPGFVRFRVRPQLGHLKQASIRHPSPRGPIDLKVSQENPSSWQAIIHVPPTTTAEFHLPHGVNRSPVTIVHDGKPISIVPSHRDSSSDVFVISPGVWSFKR